MAFDKEPITLRTVKHKSYTKKIGDTLMNTIKRDASVEYYLCKWQMNKEGGIEKVNQSKSFRMDGNFKPHGFGHMELCLDDSG